MIPVDLRTIFFSYILTNLVSLIVMIILWRQSRKRFKGTNFLVADFLLQVLCILLIFLRGYIPDFLSIVISNTFAVAGAVLGFVGLEYFTGKRSFQLHNFLLIGVFFGIHTYFTFISPNLEIRDLNFSVISLIIFSQCAWLLLKRVPIDLRKLSLVVGIVFLLFSVVDIIRVIEFFTNNHLTTDYFHSNVFETFVIISYQLLFIFLTFSLTLMINRRLLKDIASQEEKFSKAFHTVPYAVIIARLTDGCLLEVNGGFEKITGFSTTEVIGKTTPELKLWANDTDRGLLISSIIEKGNVKEIEVMFRKKSGELFTGQLSSELITINNESCILSVIIDVTERSRSERALKESEAKFRELFVNMEEGFALHEVIYDDSHHAIDYKIIDINPAFEKQVGITIEKASGALATQLYGISPAPYLEEYAKVAETGEPYSFQTYFPPLDKHFEISVFSPNPGFFATIFTDITSRKKAEEELKINLTKFKVLFESFPVGITISNAEGRIIESNSIAEELLGMSEAEQLNRQISGEEWQIIRPDGSPMPSSEFASVRALNEGKKITNIEMGLVKSKTLTTWINVSAVPIPLEGYGVAIVYNDITGKKSGELSLLLEQQFSQSLLDSLPGIFYLYSYPELKLVRWNKNHETIFGYSQDELNQMSIENWNRTDSRNTVFAAMQEVIEKGHTMTEAPLYTKEGIQIPFILTGVKFESEGKTFIMGVGFDNTERKKAESELRENEVQYRNLADSGMALIWRSDTDKLCNYFNEPWLKFTGRTLQQEIGNGWTEGVHPDDFDRCLAIYVTAFDKREPFNMDYRLRHADGDYRWLMDKGTPNFNVEGEFVGYIGHCFDISELKQVEEEIKHKNEELHKINAEKDKFFSIIAHDLKSPFNSFLGYTELMVDELDNMSLKQIQTIAVDMKRSANYLYGLLENLLYWSRIQRGISGFDPSTFLLKPKIEDSINAVIELANKKGIAITMMIPDDIEVFADSNMLESIIRNLTTNAVKFTPKGGGVKINARAAGNNQVEISVADTGIGMDKEMVAKLFQLDEQASRKGTDGEPSTGLGLIICKDFIEKHGGSIWVESADNEGSTFYFTIPMNAI